MKGKKMNKKTITLLATGLIVTLLVISSCQKKTEPAATPAPVTPVTEANTAVLAAVEQTMCPVMVMAIDKNIFTEYQGKKVYFCCPECKSKFEKEPEKYLDKLPQFKK
jgi:YHS domain-containing protein